MLDLSKIAGLPPAHACEAYRAAERLSDAAVFLLMGLLPLTKSDDVRVLTIRQLAGRPALCRPLTFSGSTLKEVMRELSSPAGPRYILSAQGYRKFHCAPDGNIVKHRFSVLRELLRSVGCLNPMLGDRVEDVHMLRTFMLWICERRVINPQTWLPVE